MVGDLIIRTFLTTDFGAQITGVGTTFTVQAGDLESEAGELMVLVWFLVGDLAGITSMVTEVGMEIIFGAEITDTIISEM